MTDNNKRVVAVFFVLLIIIVILSYQLFLLPRTCSAIPSPTVPSHSANVPAQVRPDYNAWLHKIKPEYREKCTQIFKGESVSFSQAAQDWIIYHNHFLDRGWGEGFYIDIGTNMPEKISNTFFFDTCLGWPGLCVEPVKEYHESILAQRTCTLVQHCVLDEMKNMSMTGIQLTENGQGKAVQCVTFKWLMENYMKNREPKFDLLSIDVESYEHTVLRCFPFHLLQGTLFLVEINKQRLTDVDLFFHRNNFSNVESFVNSEGDGFVGDHLDCLYKRNPERKYYPDWSKIPANNNLQKRDQQWEGPNSKWDFRSCVY